MSPFNGSRENEWKSHPYINLFTLDTIILDSRNGEGREQVLTLVKGVFKRHGDLMKRLVASWSSNKFLKSQQVKLGDLKGASSVGSVKDWLHCMGEQVFIRKREKCARANRARITPASQSSTGVIVYAPVAPPRKRKMFRISLYPCHGTAAWDCEVGDQSRPSIRTVAIFSPPIASDIKCLVIARNR